MDNREDKVTPANLYILRYSLPPEPSDARPARLAALESFCRSSTIDEVMFFIMPEEYNRGQWDPSHYQPWLDMAAEGRQRVCEMGLDVSLNPWITILHCSRGRRSAGMHYRRLVSDTGQTSPSVACHLCPDWQALFLRTFTDFARAGFKTIWIEDDFRFHNHDHGWGGCFCEAHIAALRLRGARARSREELLVHLNAPGGVHPDRLLWMELNRDTSLDMAVRLRQAMNAVDPAIRLGLMCSDMRLHALEGRDWHRLIAALGGPDRVPVRPHGGSYQETIRDGIITPLANLSASLTALPPQTQSWFELENCPMSAYAKSNQLSVAQMAVSLHAGCVGVTLDILDFLGTGPDCEPSLAPMLAQHRDRLLRVRDAALQGVPAGIVCLFPDATCARAPGNGGPLDSLPIGDYGWFRHLQAYGWPATVRTINDTFAPEAHGCYALSGAAAWGLTDAQIVQLTQTACLLLDAPASAILLQRGFGHRVGIRKIRWWTHAQHPFSIEQQVDRLPGSVPCRAGVNIVGDDWSLVTFDLLRTGKVHTEIHDCDLQRMGNGAFWYMSAEGGGGYVLPLGLPLPASLHGRTRKHWLDDALCALGVDRAMPHVESAAWIYSEYRRGEDTDTLLLLNTGLDEHESLAVLMPPGQYEATIVACSRNAANCTGEANRLILNTRLAGGDWLVLQYRQTGRSV